MLLIIIEVQAGTEVLLTVMFIPLNNCETSLLRGEVDSTEELFRNRCSSNIDAVGLSGNIILESLCPLLTSFQVLVGYLSLQPMIRQTVLDIRRKSVFSICVYAYPPLQTHSTEASQ